MHVPGLLVHIYAQWRDNMWAYALMCSVTHKNVCVCPAVCLQKTPILQSNAGNPQVLGTVVVPLQVWIVWRG